MAAINTFCSYLGGVFISIAALVMLIDVIGRYIFNSPSLYAPFIVSFLVLGALFFGIPYSFQAGGQVHIETIVDRIPPLARKICFSFGYCLTIFFVTFMFRACLRFSGMAFSFNWVTVGNVLMPMGILYAIMTFGYAFLILAVISKFVQIWLRKNEDRKEEGKG